MNIRKRKILAISFLVLIALVVISIFVFELDQYFVKTNIPLLYNKLVEYNHIIIPILAIIIIGCTIVGIPVVVFVILSGFFFPIWTAFFLTWITSTIGIIITYYNSNFLFNFFIEKLSDKHEKIEKMNLFFKKYGFWAIVILRTIYFFPANVINLGISSTSIKPGQYIFGSLIGLIPVCLINVYVGHLMAIGLKLI